MLERFYNSRDIHILKGKTVTSVSGLYHGSREVKLRCSDGTAYKMYHATDGGESIYLSDYQRLCFTPVPSAIRLSDDEDYAATVCEGALLGTINYAERIMLDREEMPELGKGMGMTKTLFLLSTENGVVALTWNAISDNGYVSAEVDFVQTEGEGLWKEEPTL